MQSSNLVAAQVVGAMIELDNRYDRRTLLREIGVTMLGVGLAGCTGPGSSGGEDGEDGEEDENGESGGDDEEEEGGGYSGERLHRRDSS